MKITPEELNAAIEKEEKEAPSKIMNIAEGDSTKASKLNEEEINKPAKSMTSSTWADLLAVVYDLNADDYKKIIEGSFTLSDIKKMQNEEEGGLYVEEEEDDYNEDDIFDSRHKINKEFNRDNVVNMSRRKFIQMLGVALVGTGVGVLSWKEYLRMRRLERFDRNKVYGVPARKKVKYGYNFELSEEIYMTLCSGTAADTLIIIANVNQPLNSFTKEGINQIELYYNNNVIQINNLLDSVLITQNYISNRNKIFFDEVKEQVDDQIDKQVDDFVFKNPKERKIIKTVVKYSGKILSYTETVVNSVNKILGIDSYYQLEEINKWRGTVDGWVLRGNANDVFKKYKKLKEKGIVDIFNGSVKEIINNLNDANVSIADLYVNGTTKYNHRAVAFKENNGNWYVIDPYTKGCYKILLQDYVKKNITRRSSEKRHIIAAIPLSSEILKDIKEDLDN